MDTSLQDFLLVQGNVVPRIFQVFKFRIEFFKIFQKFLFILEGRFDFMIPGDLHPMLAMSAATDGFFANRNGLVDCIEFALIAFLPM